MNRVKRKLLVVPLFFFSLWPWIPSSLYSQTPWPSSPWEGNMNQILLKSRCSFHYSSHIPDKGEKKRSSWITADLEGSFRTHLWRWERWKARMILHLAKLQGVRGVKCIGITLGDEYRLMDDLAGDPFSLVVGGQVTVVNRKNIRYRELFLFAPWNGEIYCTLGREKTRREEWTSRFWNSVACGIANRGRSWLKISAHYEKKWSQEKILQLFMRGVAGWGKRALSEYFTGYASLPHRSLEIGSQYTFSVLDNSSLCSCEYSYRPYAKNAPRKVSTLSIEWNLPITP